MCTGPSAIPAYARLVQRALEPHAGVDDDPTVVGREQVAVREPRRHPDAVAQVDRRRAGRRRRWRRRRAARGGCPASVHLRADLGKRVEVEGEPLVEAAGSSRSRRGGRRRTRPSLPRGCRPGRSRTPGAAVVGELEPRDVEDRRGHRQVVGHELAELDVDPLRAPGSDRASRTAARSSRSIRSTQYAASSSASMRTGACRSP